MLSAKKWNYISNLKTLTQDEFGHTWFAENSLNGYLAYLPWWGLDQKINKTCLLYQVDSKGKLYILCIMYIIRIRTHCEGYTIVYSHDKEHARLHTYRINKMRLNKVGIMSLVGVSHDSSKR